jgi:hypothetical protein
VKTDAKPGFFETMRAVWPVLFESVKNINLNRKSITNREDLPGRGIGRRPIGHSMSDSSVARPSPKLFHRHDRTTATTASTTPSTIDIIITAA